MERVKVLFQITAKAHALLDFFPEVFGDDVHDVEHHQSVAIL